MGKGNFIPCVSCAIWPASVQVGRPARKLCLRCAGLMGDGFLEWTAPHRVYPCVVCGEEAVTDVISDEGLERPVCYGHFAPGYRIDLALAWEGLKLAVVTAWAVTARRMWGFFRKPR